MINYSAITMEQLNQEHPERLLWKTVYPDYTLAYRGGLEFKRAAGMAAGTIASTQAGLTGGAQLFDAMADRNRRRRFLYQLEGEPDVKYISRWEKCYYVSYVQAIIDYCRNWLFTNEPVIRPALEDEDAEEVPDEPEWYAAFSADASGNGQSLLDMAKDLFGEVLILRRAGWLIGQPDASIGVEGESPITLTTYRADEILDWQENECGDLEWILLSKKQTRRTFPEVRTQAEIRTYVDRDSWGAWEVIKNEHGVQQANFLDGGKHSLGSVPFEWMTVPEGLWPMNKLFAWQIDLFNAMSMLSYSTQIACFLQPYIKSTEGSENATNRILGEGILLSLRAGDGDRESEEFGWAVPEVAPLEFQAKRLIEQRDEGYRIMHQMSLAVDSQAIGAIARSGASKIEDRKATEILLCGYGGYTRSFLIRTLNKVSKIMGDGTTWIVDGYDNFDVSSMEEELQTAALAQTFKIDSPTFEAELQKTIATGRVLGRVDETIKSKIRQEIDDNVEAKAEAALLGPPQIDPKTGALMQPPEIGMPQQPPSAAPRKPPGPPIKG